MLIYRAYKTELKINNKERSLLVQCAGAARFVYNWGLTDRIEKREKEIKTSKYDQTVRFNAIKDKLCPWIRQYPYKLVESEFINLEAAYQNFFRRVKQGTEKPGFPKFKSKKKGVGSFTLRVGIKAKKDAVKLPRIGWFELKEKGYIPTEGIKILSATISEKAGRWFVSIQVEQEIEVTQATAEPVGVDLGIKTLAVCSSGQSFENPKALKQAQKKLRRLQRELARRKTGGNNREKTKQKIANLHYRIANIRKDTLHKTTSSITAINKQDRPSVVVIEDLNISGMVKNRNLAQAISDVGMGEFRRQIEYKTLWAGENLLIAPRFFASSKTCSDCGVINKELTLAHRYWTCICGSYHDRDKNASYNLRNLATGSSSESCAYGQSVSLDLSSSSGGSRNQAQSLEL